MRRLWLIVPLAGSLIACQNGSLRDYDAQAMPGLASPFTANCTALRVVAGDLDETLAQSDVRRVFGGTPNPGPRTVTASCLAMSDGTLVETGRSQINVNARTHFVYIGSGEGSTAAADFARGATVSGVFPIIRAE
ncbi:hypothetical protein V3W47_14590 [Deinococcus sp. YIM 134068]|uniref:hypothetical protein n=1 Tax=Deinococcus lichenicola TaxID=3118910 RepID=UPI002F920D67